jgi:AraC-like DNA-binding protein
MTNVYDFLKYQPETYRQFVCKDLLIVYYNCPQFRQRDNVFTHHSCFTFYITGGKRMHRQNKTWVLEKGSLLFIKKGGFIQELYLDEGTTAISFYVADQYLNKLTHNFRQFYRGKLISDQFAESIFTVDVNETTAGFIQTMIRFFDQAVLPDETVWEERFQEFFYTLLVNPENKQLVAYLNSLTDRPRTSLYEVMYANYMYHLSLEEYARIANRSLATFKREFKKVFTTTPAQWLIQKRLDYALALLTTTEKSISDIVFDSGFENGSHFSRVFKDKFGVSPLHYRKRQLRQPEPALVA